jgi:hypothetical protein
MATQHLQKHAAYRELQYVRSNAALADADLQLDPGERLPPVYCHGSSRKRWATFPVR